MDGSWDCDDLAALVRILVRNRDLLDAMETGLARFGGWAAARLARAAPQYARRQPPQHRRALRPRQRALPAVPGREPDVFVGDLRATRTSRWKWPQRRKLDRICRKLDLRPGDHVVEIGTGWGGFALHAASHYGCRVTTTTISREQHALASARVAEAGLAIAVTLLLQDYRDLEGHYDKLVSIEMIEAIGHSVPRHLLRQVRRACSSPTAWR